jgi:hypothetical protein
MLRLIAVMINGIGSGMIWCTKKLDKGDIHNTRESRPEICTQIQKEMVQWTNDRLDKIRSTMTVQHTLDA